jgi:mannose-6-phosphate isomerase-like protein (cupin superfamily)
LASHEMKPAIRHSHPKAEFETSERCSVMEISNTPDDPEVSIARVRVAAGVTTRWHRITGTTERYVIMDGSGLMEVGELPPHAVKAGDVVLIPPSCRQRITNTGHGDLIFLAICTPRFMQAAYEDIESDLL